MARVLILTTHAIDRYVERVEPGVPAHEAEARLRLRLPYAHPTGARTDRGEAIWYLPGDPPACLIVKPDGGVVTVGGWDLDAPPPDDRAPPDAPSPEVAQLVADRDAARRASAAYQSRADRLAQVLRRLLVGGHLAEAPEPLLSQALALVGLGPAEGASAAQAESRP
jgi:hypothetical protein